MIKHPDAYQNISVSLKRSKIQLAKILEGKLDRDNRSDLFDYLISEKAKQLGVGESGNNENNH